MMTDLRAHPAYQAVVERYRMALAHFHSTPDVQMATELMGLSARRYCDSFIELYFEPFTWTSDEVDSGIAAALNDASFGLYDAAFEEAHHA